MSYLICLECGSYYELEEGESPEDFISCQCGGQLIYVEDLESELSEGAYLEYDEIKYEELEYKDNDSESQKSKPISKSLKYYFTLSVIIFFTVIGVAYIAFFMPPLSEVFSHNAPTLASDNRGTVTKEIKTVNGYSVSNIPPNTKTIAIITGMHPREKLSESAVSAVIKNYNLSSDEVIVHYDVNITDNPDNYAISRSNGEGMVSKYVIPDIKKSAIDLVIICHDHAPGYGVGYYLATPKMDTPSVTIAENIEKKLPEFKYYRSSNNSEHGSSTITVSNPLASAGFRTLVYEIPEWNTQGDAYQESKKLIASCFQSI